jgi:cytochrome P450
VDFRPRTNQTCFPLQVHSFNAGPRTCLGKDLTLVQMKAIASAVFWNYRFQVVEDHPIYPTTSMVLHMKHGLKVRVLQRRQS